MREGDPGRSHVDVIFIFFVVFAIQFRIYHDVLHPCRLQNWRVGRFWGSKRMMRTEGREREDGRYTYPPVHVPHTHTYLYA